MTLHRIVSQCNSVLDQSWHRNWKIKFQDFLGHFPGLFKQWRSEGALRPWQEIFLRPPSTKTSEFEMNNKCESCGRSKSRTFTAVILFFFEGNKTHLAL